MAFLLDRSVFVHVPKTGGQWVVAALERAGLVRERLGPVHTSPDEIEVDPALPRFAFVRHPLAWYRSIWAHRMDEGWSPVDDPDWFTPRWIDHWASFTSRTRARRFDRFVRRCVEAFPDGYVSDLYETYVEGCARVGRQERLAEDLVEILDAFGEPVDPDRLRAVSPVNVRGRTPPRRRAAEWTPELIALVVGAERRAIERFGYEEVP